MQQASHVTTIGEGDSWRECGYAESGADDGQLNKSCHFIVLLVGVASRLARLVSFNARLIRGQHGRDAIGLGSFNDIVPTASQIEAARQVTIRFTAADHRPATNVETIAPLARLMTSRAGGINNFGVVVIVQSPGVPVSGPMSASEITGC